MRDIGEKWQRELERWASPCLSAFGHKVRQRWAPVYLRGCSCRENARVLSRSPSAYRAKVGSSVILPPTPLVELGVTRPVDIDGRSTCTPKDGGRSRIRGLRLGTLRRLSAGYATPRLGVQHPPLHDEVDDWAQTFFVSDRRKHERALSTHALRVLVHHI